MIRQYESDVLVRKGNDVLVVLAPGTVHRKLMDFDHKLIGQMCEEEILKYIGDFVDIIDDMVAVQLEVEEYVAMHPEKFLNKREERIYNLVGMYRQLEEKVRYCKKIYSHLQETLTKRRRNKERLLQSITSGKKYTQKFFEKGGF